MCNELNKIFISQSQSLNYACYLFQLWSLTTKLNLENHTLINIIVLSQSLAASIKYCIEKTLGINILTKGKRVKFHSNQNISHFDIWFCKFFNWRMSILFDSFRHVNVGSNLYMNPPHYHMRSWVQNFWSVYRLWWCLAAHK